jgi:hypothetical protein
MSDRIARAERAETAYREFIEPMIDELDAEYADRILEVATTELFFWRRTSKITRLSDSLRTVRMLRAGMLAIIRDGDLAKSDKAKAEKPEQMTAAARRLFNMAPH